MKKKNSLFILALTTSGILFIITTAFHNPVEYKNYSYPSSTLTDIHGNVYYNITTGKQVWMEERINTLRLSIYHHRSVF